MRHGLIILHRIKDLENSRDYVDWQHPEKFTFLSHHQARVRQDPNNLSGRRGTHYPMDYNVKELLFNLELQPSKEAQKDPRLKDVGPSGEVLGVSVPDFGRDFRSS